MGKKAFKLNKLMRDGLPKIMRESGVIVKDRIMDKEEFIEKLKDKLVEEAQEVIEARDEVELIEELSDVLEVIQTLLKASGITMEQIEEKRIHKKKIKGGFESRIFAHSVEMDDSNSAKSYFHKYDELLPHHTHKSDCLFCKFGKDLNFPIYAKFKHCYVIKDQFPVSNGHVLIIPYEHTENWFTASEEVRQDIMKALSIVKEKLDIEYSPQGYNIGANCGEVAGQTIMHLHLHLIPRYVGDMKNPRGGVRGVIPSKQSD
jgi:diadenosine tetraphosphate (Ap4A) HIT family hydrolase/predicted house-cleaning noncanonical NTP pyrophosphatase (MazG superfamily)